VPRVIQVMQATGTLPKTDRHKARHTTARLAKDTDDLHYLLDVLGLWPNQDGKQPLVPPMPIDPCTLSIRRRRP